MLELFITLRQIMKVVDRLNLRGSLCTLTCKWPGRLVYAIARSDLE